LNRRELSPEANIEWHPGHALVDDVERDTVHAQELLEIGPATAR
jgi:hypothetical protein